jgi:hypothetical protein
MGRRTRVATRKMVSPGRMVRRRGTEPVVKRKGTRAKEAGRKVRRRMERRRRRGRRRMRSATATLGRRVAGSSREGRKGSPAKARRIRRTMR